MLRKGGYTKDDFTNDFKEMYNDVGLDVRDEHLHQVFDTLSKKIMMVLLELNQFKKLLKRRCHH